MHTINDNIIDQMLESPYCVIDILPTRVPDNGKGKYFEVEKYYLKHTKVDQIFEKFANVLLKLNCYENLDMLTQNEGWVFNPAPEALASHVMNCPDHYQNLIILLKDLDAMITINGDDTYMTAYNLDADSQHLLRDFALSEGLFLWNPRETA
mgnify:CR=1 FL=1